MNIFMHLHWCFMHVHAFAKFAMIWSWGAWLVPDPVVHWLDWGIWILLRKVWLGLHEGCHHVWNSGRLWRWISYLPGQGLWPRGKEIQVECWTCKRTSGNDGHYRYVLSRWCCAQHVACSLCALYKFFACPSHILRMFFVGSLQVLCTFFACSLRVLCIFFVGFLHVLCMFFACSLHVLCMFFACFQVSCDLIALSFRHFQSSSRALGASILGFNTL